MRRLNLTLAGTGSNNSGLSGGSIFGNRFRRNGSNTPPPPAAPPTPAAPAAPRSGATRTGAENIRNQGGGRGVSTANMARALKSLTGQ